MRTLNVSKTGIQKLKSHQFELRTTDFEDSTKSLSPGEWCVITGPGSSEKWIGFGNPMVDEKYTSFYVIKKLEESATIVTAQDLIRSRIKSAREKRLRFSGYDRGARVFYGASDGLPGLIIDTFVNASIIQINTAGLDRYRELIKETVKELTQIDAVLLDNPKYREKESLPTYPKDSVPDLLIEENGINFKLRADVIQKVGFYYDHRENRRQLMMLLERLPKPERGVDLFCYAGAWGLSALKAGVKKLEFVDQGDFQVDVNKGLELNGFDDRGEFLRLDVFKYLDQRASESAKFDLILCDPPAFAKSQAQKKDALDGYSKLHRKVFKIASPGALIAFSSCTHYVDHAEFQKNILEAAAKENKKVQLLYCGLQGWDHPVSSLGEKTNYIKSYFYLLES